MITFSLVINKISDILKTLTKDKLVNACACTNFLKISLRSYNRVNYTVTKN